MKLRFRDNSLRLRVNRREVETLASGHALQEKVVFPNQAQFHYSLEPKAETGPAASFEEGAIRISAPLPDLLHWANDDSVGLYFEFPAFPTALRVAIEKDLECVDGPPEEQDPHAFPRDSGKHC